MGKAFIKTENGWTESLLHAKTASGYARVKTAFRKVNSTTWTPFLTQDMTPPGVPIIASLTQSGTSLVIKITAPTASDLKSVRVKVGRAIAANVDTDSDYISTPDGTDVAWSEWTMSPGQTRTKNYPPVGSLSSGVVYYVTAWAQDTSRNFSPPAVASIKYTQTTAPTAKITKIWLPTIDSNTFSRVSNKHDRDDKYVRVGRPQEYIGLWYYGARFGSTIEQAKKINKARIQMQRVSTTNYVGAAQFRIYAHTLPSYSNVDLDTGGRIVVVDTVWNTLSRGQSATFDLPDAWLPLIKSGKIKGFGVMSQVSSGVNEIDPYDATFQGFGTTSGRVYLEFET